MEEIRRRLPELALQASGGVASLDDISILAATGAAGAIVGKALWEGEIDLAEAVKRAGA
jgi:phosphoribosylformimino-5-aminoimidazole carboxamide ribotide isomerase